VDLERHKCTHIGCRTKFISDFSKAMLSHTRRLFSNPVKLADFPIVTTDGLSGFKIVRVCGIATGSTVRTRDFTKDMASAFKTIIGGELTHYTSLMQESRQEALDRMRETATKLGANAIVGSRMVTANIAPTASEVMAYGTAVVVEPVDI
jgi:uncharacterized protein YbjQ (UPF0145 family)